MQISLKQLVKTIILQKNPKLELSDKSDPDEIRDELGMSKKTFKQAIGKLFKAKKII